MSAIQAAVFSSDDQRVFTIGTDQNLIIYKIDLQKGTKSELTRLKTKYCVDMTLRGNSLASVNKETAYCYSFDKPKNLRGIDAEDLEMEESRHNSDLAMVSDTFTVSQEDYEDIGSPNVRLIDGNATITAINLSKDGSYLLANLSFDKPRIECWHLATGESRGKYRGHE